MSTQRPSTTSAQAEPARPAGPVASAGPPVFVVGCPRSGTTMLRAMLDAHPALAIPPESHFITAMWRARRRYARADGVDAARMVDDVLRLHRFKEWGTSAEAVWSRARALERPSFAAVVEAVFMAYAEEHGKSRWGDKTPNYTLDVALLAELFPGSRFVHLIRDGRDVVLSQLEMPWWPNKLTEAAEVWTHWTRTACAAGERLGPERYVEVRYEELVDDPESGLRQVCSFAGLPYKQEMLTYSKARSAGGTPDYHRNAQGPPVKGLRDWSRDMSRDDLAVFEAIASDQLHSLGYTPSFERIPFGARVRANAARAMNGASRRLRDARVRAALAVRRDVLPPPRRW